MLESLRKSFFSRDLSQTATNANTPHMVVSPSRHFKYSSLLLECLTWGVKSPDHPRSTAHPQLGLFVCRDVLVYKSMVVDTWHRCVGQARLESVDVENGIMTDAAEKLR